MAPRKLPTSPTLLPCFRSDNYTCATTAAKIITIAGCPTTAGTVTHTTGSLNQGQATVGSGAAVNDIQSSTSLFDFAPFFTTDWGSTLKATYAGLPTANSRSFVTAAGTLTGSAHNSDVNPFANLTADAGIFTTLPCYGVNLSGATSQWLINANDVVLSGCGTGGDSILTANGSFPYQHADDCFQQHDFAS